MLCPTLLSVVGRDLDDEAEDDSVEDEVIFDVKYANLETATTGRELSVRTRRSPSLFRGQISRPAVSSSSLSGSRSTLDQNSSVIKN